MSISYSSSAHSALQLRPTEPEDLAALSELFERRFGRPLSAAEWTWKYRQLPGEGRSWVAALGPPGAEVVAHSGALRLPARWSGGEGGIWQLVDWVASERQPHLRPPLVDLGRSLLSDLPGEHDAPWIFGFPSDRHFRLGQRVFGYRPLAEIAPLEGDVAAAAVGREIAWGDVAPEGAAEIWTASGGPFGIVRSAAFLNWRYHARPDRYYRIYSPEASGVSGLVVVGFAGRLAQVAELWLPRGRDWRADLAGIAADLATAGIETWAVWPPPADRPDLDEAFAELGLRPAEERVFLGCRGRQEGPDPVAAAEGFYCAMGDYDLV